MLRVGFAALCLSISFVLLVGGTILTAQALSSPPLIAADLRQFPECQFPCWNGIRPDETSIVRANRILSESGYALDLPSNTDVVYYRYPPLSPERCGVQLDVRDTIVRRVRLENCPPTRIGDLIRVLDKPTGVLAERSAVTFGEGGLIAFVYPVACERVYQPDAFISSIDLRTADMLSGYLLPWRGFLDGRFYQPHPQASVNCRP